jgi:hypothetical protein
MCVLPMCCHIFTDVLPYLWRLTLIAKYVLDSIQPLIHDASAY